LVKKEVEKQLKNVVKSFVVALVSALSKRMVKVLRAWRSEESGHAQEEERKARNKEAGASDKAEAEHWREIAEYWRERCEASERRFQEKSGSLERDCQSLTERLSESIESGDIVMALKDDRVTIDFDFMEQGIISDSLQ